MSRQEVLEAAGWAVDSREAAPATTSSSPPRTPSRSDLDYLIEVFEAAIEAGRHGRQRPRHRPATRCPQQYGALFATCASACRASTRSIWSTHCHNDLGMAVANSLAAVRGGARQIECTINGIGERAGNTSLEEVVMALKTRRDYFGARHRHRAPSRSTATSRLVSQITGIAVPAATRRSSASNAFAHEAGIHQDGVLKDALDLRDHAARGGRAPVEPAWSSASTPAATRFVDRLNDARPTSRSEREIEAPFERFKTLADKKKDVYDEDLVALVAEENRTAVRRRYELRQPERDVVEHGGAARDGEAPHRRRRAARRRFRRRHGRRVLQGAQRSDRVAHPRLDRYVVKAITGGTDAQGEVSCLVRDGDHGGDGQGATPTSSWRARSPT